MKKFTLLAAGFGFFTMMSAGYAADHNFTATAAGGLTEGVSQPFLNGINNPAQFDADHVPGQGSPLSGFEHEVPATDTPNNGKGTELKPVSDGKTAPSANSVHSPIVP